MKSSRLGPGRAALERGSTFSKPRTQMARSAGPKSRVSRRRRRSQAERDASALWAEEARRPCVVCGDVDVEIHHVIHQQQLKKIARTLNLDLPALLWDRRGALALCGSCHAAHHAALPRLARRYLRRWCPDVFAFAAEIGLSYWLEKTYPEDP